MIMNEGIATKAAGKMRINPITNIETYLWCIVVKISFKKGVLLQFEAESGKKPVHHPIELST